MTGLRHIGDGGVKIGLERFNLSDEIIGCYSDYTH